MASSIETTSTTTTLKNNGTAYISVDTTENVTLAHPLALAQGGSGAVSVNGIVQIVNTQTGAVAQSTTVMPIDNTIPQITEGAEYMTLAITPKHADNLLLIQSIAQISVNTGTSMGMALFVGTTANALAAIGGNFNGGSVNRGMSLTHHMVAGGTSELTFRIRIGSGASGTTAFNSGEAVGTRLFGGVCASSITITEYSV
jgi:hypothetical protein